MTIMQGSVVLLAVVAASLGQAAQLPLAKRASDYISSCGNSSMARDDVKSNHGAISRRGYLTAVTDFCKQADGKSVPAGGYLSMATRVYQNSDGDPTIRGVNGYVYFEVHNKQSGSNDHEITADDCNDHYQQLSNGGSKCADSQFNDTKGGVWEVGSDQVSYQAIGQTVLPAQDAVDKLYDQEPLTVRQGKDGTALDPFPTDFTKDVTPIPCHSHNDYVQPVPLFLALTAGCISVEGDVYIYGKNLRVSHQDPGDTGPTLEQLYLDPIKAILDAQQSVFPVNKDQDLVMLIDFKNSPNETWDAVVEALQPMRDAGYLSHWDGSKFVRGKVTVVATGGAPLEKANDASANPNHTVFIDAPLGQPLDTYNASNSFYASASYLEAVAFNFETNLSPDDLKKIKDQVGKAHAQNLTTRYYEIPSKDMWQGLLDNGVDRINVDYFEDLAGLDFSKPSYVTRMNMLIKLTTTSSGSSQSGSPSGPGSGPGSTSTPSIASRIVSGTYLYALFAAMAFVLLLVR